MNRRRGNAVCGYNRQLVLAALLGVVLLASGTGCLARDRLLGAVADDLALITSSATQGFLVGLFNDVFGA
jgi:hypothetical protein